MSTVWLRLTVPGFGQPAGAVVAADDTDSRVRAILNADLAAPVPDPGTPVPVLAFTDPVIGGAGSSPVDNHDGTATL